MSPFDDVAAIRRVVTGTNREGEPGVCRDDVAPRPVESRRYPGVTGADLWRDDGTRFFVVTIAGGVSVPVHATLTIDHHCVVSGEIVCLLGGQEVTVSAGEVLVVRGEAHGWRNDHDEPWVSLVTMVARAGSVAAPGSTS